jgi:hypothetical protein
MQIITQGRDEDDGIIVPQELELEKKGKIL